MTINTPPTVAFDPANQQHRMAVGRFMKRYSWADAGIRFSYEPEYNNLVDQIKDRLLKHYLQQEPVACE